MGFASEFPHHQSHLDNASQLLGFVDASLFRIHFPDRVKARFSVLGGSGIRELACGAWSSPICDLPALSKANTVDFAPHRRLDCLPLSFGMISRCGMDETDAWRDASSKQGVMITGDIHRQGRHARLTVRWETSYRPPS